MNTESRTKNVSRNLIFSFIAYFIQIVLGFLVRRYFIFYFNEEYLGLNSLFSNVLSILSLAELGFGTAIVFAMYKPMADGDEEKVRQLLQFYKKCYFIIGMVVFFIGLCVFPFMNIFQKKAPNVNANLHIVYLIFLANASISYFFAHRRSLLYASQRNDIEAKVNIIINILLSVFQFVIILCFKNYYFYILASGIMNLINNFWVYGITQRKYKEFVKKPFENLSKDEIKSINKNIYAMIFHKIGGTVVYSTDSLIIYLMLGSSSLGKYSNYLLITTQINSLLQIFLSSIRGSIGNSIATETIEKNQKLLKNLNFIYFWLITFCTACIFTLSDSFIDVILNKSNIDLTFNLPILIVICLNFFILQSRYVVCVFKECAGLFYQDKYKCIFEAIVNLVVSIVLAKFIGITGVVIGTICSNVFVCLWVEPLILNKYYLKQSTVKYFINYFISFFIMLITTAVTYLSCLYIPTNGLLMLIIKFGICAIVPNLVLLIFYCRTTSFKETKNWVIEKLKSLKRKKTVETNQV